MNLRYWPITYWILAVLGAVFVVQLVGGFVLEPVAFQTPVGVVVSDAINADFALWPARVLQGDALIGIFTSIFLHAGFIHFIFNGFALFMFGKLLEMRIGKKNFLKLFFAAGIVGSLVHIAFSSLTGWAFYIPALGASGAIFGLLGALIILRPDIKVMTLPIPIPMPLWQAVLMFTVFFMVFAPYIAHDVHMAGLGVGLLFGLYFKGKMAKDADYSWRAVYNTPTVKDPYEWIDNYR